MGSREQGSCPCPSPATALRRMGPAPLLGSRVELAPDMVVIGSWPQGHKFKRASSGSCLLGSSETKLRHTSPHPSILHHLWQVGELAPGS